MRVKKKIICFMTCMAVICSSTSFLYANDGSQGEDQPTSAADRYQEYLDEEGQTFEDFYAGNPRLREMYGGYKREGVFKLRASNGTIYNAQAMYVTWESGGTAQYYVVNGKSIKRGANDSAREINIYQAQPFVLKKDMKYAYSEPFDDTLISGKTIPAGTYTSTRSSYDFIEIELNDGSKVWINTQYTPNYDTTSNGYFVNTKDVLDEKTINGIPVNQMLMPVSEEHRPGYPMRPSYVTIHNTGNSTNGANAKSHATLQYNGNPSAFTSWHFTVDNNSIYQSMPMNEIGYHAGDGFNNGNGATVAIEICMNKDGNYAQAEKNAAMLTAHILYANGLPSDAVRNHNDWSGKDCPENILNNKSGTMGWDQFKATVKTEYDKLVAENGVPSISESIPESYTNMMTTENLKFQQGYISGIALDTTSTTIIEKLKAVDAESTISLLDATGKKIETEVPIATGQYLRIEAKDDKQYYIAIVLYGDVNGDGKIQATDYVKIKNMIMDKGTLSGAYVKAADANHDGKVQATDYVKIKNHIMGKSEVSQHE